MNFMEQLWQDFWNKLRTVVRQLVKHCIFCQKRKRNDEIFKTVGRYSGYGVTLKYHYHESCLTEVIDDPETHGHQEIDIALDILNCKELKEQKRRRAAEWQAIRHQQIKDFRDRRLP